MLYLTNQINGVFIMNKNYILLILIISLSLISCGEIDTTNPYSGPNIPNRGDTGGVESNSNTPGWGTIFSSFSDKTIGINKADKTLGSSGFFVALINQSNKASVNMVGAKKSSSNRSNLDLDVSSFSYTSSTGELTLSESGLNKIKGANLSDGKIYEYEINFEVIIPVSPTQTNKATVSRYFQLIEGEFIPEYYITSLMQSLGNITIDNKSYTGESTFDFSSISDFKSGSPNYTIQYSSSDAGNYGYKNAMLRIKLNINKKIVDSKYLSKVGHNSYYEFIDGEPNSIIMHISYETKPGYIMPKTVLPGGISIKLILGSEGKWLIP